MNKKNEREKNKKKIISSEIESERKKWKEISDDLRKRFQCQGFDLLCNLCGLVGWHIRVFTVVPIRDLSVCILNFRPQKSQNKKHFKPIFKIPKNQKQIQ
jgi:hypothetical protein